MTDEDDLQTQVQLLKEENRALRTKLEAIEEVLIGSDVEDGTSIFDPEFKSDDGLVRRVSKLANGGVSSQGHENRDALMPLHAMWIDVRDGADDRISNASVRRAAILFRELLRQATDGSRSAVGVTRERFIIAAPDAKQPILEHDDTVDTLSSQQVKRAFAQAQMLSGRNCDCDDLAGCDHGLVVARFDESTNRLTADREALLAYLRELEDDGQEDADGRPDDPVDPGEDATAADEHEAAAELDALTTAQSNAGVSSSDAPALDHEAAADGGTQPR